MVQWKYMYVGMCSLLGGPVSLTGQLYNRERQTETDRDRQWTDRDRQWTCDISSMNCETAGSPIQSPDLQRDIPTLCHSASPLPIHLCVLIAFDMRLALYHTVDLCTYKDKLIGKKLQRKNVNKGRGLAL